MEKGVTLRYRNIHSDMRNVLKTPSVSEGVSSGAFIRRRDLRVPFFQNGIREVRR